MMVLYCLYGLLARCCSLFTLHLSNNLTLFRGSVSGKCIGTLKKYVKMFDASFVIILLYCNPQYIIDGM